MKGHSSASSFQFSNFCHFLLLFFFTWSCGLFISQDFYFNVMSFSVLPFCTGDTPHCHNSDRKYRVPAHTATCPIMSRPELLLLKAQRGEKNSAINMFNKSNCCSPRCLVTSIYKDKEKEVVQKVQLSIYHLHDS